jgi:hypothetical protein
VLTWSVLTSWLRPSKQVGTAHCQLRRLTKNMSECSHQVSEGAAMLLQGNVIWGALMIYPVLAISELPQALSRRKLVRRLVKMRCPTSSFEAIARLRGTTVTTVVPVLGRCRNFPRAQIGPLRVQVGLLSQLSIGALAVCAKSLMGLNKRSLSFRERIMPRLTCDRMYERLVQSASARARESTRMQ